MMKNKQSQEKTFDYIGAYEQAIADIITTCGSREAANKMLDEIYKHYEKTDAAIRKLAKECGRDTQRFETEKALLLQKARHDLDATVEAHAPHTKEHMKEIILGASLAIAAIVMPVVYPASLLLTASSVMAIGSSYYIGFNNLSRWKALAGKSKISSLLGVIRPRRVKLEGIMKKK